MSERRKRVDMKVGVIGNGFVGNSIYHTFMPTIDVKVYDVNPVRSTHSLKDVLRQDIIFVCVPTPMHETGEIDLSYVNGVFDSIKNEYDILNEEDQILGTLDEWHGRPIFVLKSTVVPGTTDGVATRTGLKIVFSPEFLTERTAVTDSICSNHVIVGGDSSATEEVETLYKQRFGNGYNVIKTDTKTAEFIKYMRNTFFATKVTFMNEMFRIALNCGVDWETAVSGFAMDGRIGHSHLSVPGHDGMYGYGGTCFPKDVSAITEMARQQGFIPQLLTTVQTANLSYRGVEDWKHSKGRAVSE